MATYEFHGLLFFFTVLFNIFAILDGNRVIASKCPNLFLWPSVLLSIFVHFYAYAVSKLDTTLCVKIINGIVFLSVGLFILVQLCFSCTENLSNTNTYMALVCNFVVFSWYFCVTIYQIILKYGVTTQPITHAIFVDPQYIYGSINQTVDVV
jgi:hypothetical protein